MLSTEKPVDLKKCQHAIVLAAAELQYHTSYHMMAIRLVCLLSLAPVGIGLAEPEECPLLQTAMRKDREGLLDR